MTKPAHFTGRPVSEGTAAGLLYIADPGPPADATAEQVREAFAAVAAERHDLAERLRVAGRDAEADIIGVAGLIAADPALVEPAVAAVTGGSGAADAVLAAAEEQASALAGLPVPELAERAGDVRQVGQAVLDRLATAGAPPRPEGSFILVRREVSPADLIELSEDGLAGAVSVAGGGSSHAAIVARGLGLPMITGVDAAVLAEPGGQPAVLDAVAGELRVGSGATAGLTAGAGIARGTGPAAGAGRAGRADTTAGAAATAGIGANGLRQARDTGPAATIDGRAITVLCNVASAAETKAGLARGAAGVGLLRTEFPFLDALAWPTLAEHRAHLAPILGLLAGRTATVRLLDFSGDKIPPFLARHHADGVPASGPSAASGSGAGRGAGRATDPGPGLDSGAGAVPDVATGSGAGVGELPAAGLAALLAHPTALRDQLRAIMEAGRAAHLGVLIPMVSSLDEVARVRAALAETAAALGAPAPRLGIMVELAATAAAAETFAPAVDFFSIGTNDLAGQVLGLDRRDPAARPALAADPRVLRLIGHVTQAARTARIDVSVCGDAAADAQVLPLLVGLGVGTLSVPAARVAQVRSWVAALDAGACAELAAKALDAPTVAAVWKLVPAL
jgi:phosphoenolpyruvate-protein kinase (PTS system EI component)